MVLALASFPKIKTNHVVLHDRPPKTLADRVEVLGRGKPALVRREISDEEHSGCRRTTAALVLCYLEGPNTRRS